MTKIPKVTPNPVRADLHQIPNWLGNINFPKMTVEIIDKTIRHKNWEFQSKSAEVKSVHINGINPVVNATKLHFTSSIAASFSSLVIFSHFCFDTQSYHNFGSFEKMA